MNQADRNLVRGMLETKGFLIYQLTGKGLKLAKGKYSPVYVNFKSLWANPSIMKNLSQRLAQRCFGSNAVIGIETGGSPFASFIAQELEIPLILARKEEKGAMGIFAGNVADGGGSIAIVDDVVGGGNTMSEAVNTVKRPNRLVKVVTILSYGMDRRIMVKYDIKLESLYQIEDFLTVMDPELSTKIRPFIINYQKFLAKALE